MSLHIQLGLGEGELSPELVKMLLKGIKDRLEGTREQGSQ